MTLKQRWRNIRPYILGPIIFCAARAIGLTLKIKTIGYDRVKDLEGGRILAGWHGRTFVAAQFFRGKGVWTIISKSKDGDMQNMIFRGFGFKTIRGSTGRGGVKAAIESIEVLKKGVMMAFTPDGPRGPSRVVQGGIMLMARKSGAWIVPVGVSANRRWLAGTWDGYMVPKPFAKCVMVYGEPVKLPSPCTEAELEDTRQRLEESLNLLEDEAERICGHGVAVTALS